ncbi:MAG: hypothetical protein AAFR01_04840, partial [Pseudomonadota bacterium]
VGQPVAVKLAGSSRPHGLGFDKVFIGPLIVDGVPVGQPGTPAPNAAIEAVRSSVQTDRLGYTLANLHMDHGFASRFRLSRGPHDVHDNERCDIAAARERPHETLSALRAVKILRHASVPNLRVYRHRSHGRDHMSCYQSDAAQARTQVRRHIDHNVASNRLCLGRQGLQKIRAVVCAF